MLGFSTQNLKFLPVDLHLEGVVFDLSRGLGFANLVHKAPLFLWLHHLNQQNRHKRQHKRKTRDDPHYLNPNCMCNLTFQTRGSPGFKMTSRSGQIPTLWEYKT